MLLQASKVLGRATRLVEAMAAAQDKREWLADKLAWRRFWKRLPDEHRRNLAFDERYGTFTAAEVLLSETGVAADRAAAGNGVYRPIWEPEFHAALALLKVPFEDFTFVDLGSGKGKGLLLAADYSFARIVGIEYSPGLHTVAESNLKRFRSPSQKCRMLETVLADAITHPLPTGPKICFIFNSFDRPTMRGIMHRLDREAARPGPLYVVYVNVRRVAEMGDALDGFVALQPLTRTRTVCILGNRGELAGPRPSGDSSIVSRWPPRACRVERPAFEAVALASRRLRI
jgi:SAM-dependent methyltransferase